MDLSLGQLSALLAVDPTRVRKWIDAGWLRAEGGGRGPGTGNYRSIPHAEVRVALRVGRVIEKYGVKASAALFERCRQLEEGADGGERGGATSGASDGASGGAGGDSC